MDPAEIALPPEIAQIETRPQVFSEALEGAGAELVMRGHIKNEEWSDATTQYRQDNYLYGKDLYVWLAAKASEADISIDPYIMTHYTRAISQRDAQTGGRSKRRRSSKKRSKKKRSKKKRSKKKRSKKRRTRKY